MKQNIDTICVQAGYQPKSGEARVVPIAQSTTFYYSSAKELAALFDLKEDGFFYSRLSNPTVAAFETKIAALEGGVAAVATASGMSAVMLSVMNLAESGDNIVSSRAVYGGTFNLFSVTLKKYGIETRFFSPDDKKEDIEKLIDDKTKIIYAESIANPTIEVLDSDKLSSLAKKYGIVFMVDNTLLSPALFRPIEWGANVVVHSSSKYLDGHAVALGGVSVDGGNFTFKGNKRYKNFNEPDESYHGLVYADVAASFATKMRAQLVRDTGAIMSPENAFLTNLGCETLALRMERHSANAKKVAAFLTTRKEVEWVRHPSLKSDKYYETGKKYMPDGFGGMLSFGIKGGVERAEKFMENLKLIKLVTHVADVRSCVLHPASTTHRQLSEAAMEAAGIPANLVRLSVGIENAEDIIADLAQSFDSLCL